jgi:hypothetical protein
METGIDDRIALLLAVVRDRPDLDNEGLMSALTARGLDRESASRLTVFVPLALGRVLLGGLGISFADTYLAADDAGPAKRRPLAEAAVSPGAMVGSSPGESYPRTVARRAGWGWRRHVG